MAGDDKKPDSSEVSTGNIIKPSFENLPEDVRRRYEELTRAREEEELKLKKAREEKELQQLLSSYTMDRRGVVTQIKEFTFPPLHDARVEKKIKNMTRESSKRENLGSILQDTKSGTCYLSLQHLKDITDDFSDERVLGRGGFGVVYKGVLDTGGVVAVKKLAYNLPVVNDRQFESEVYRLVILEHPNIVRILGYCSETRHMWIKHQGKYRFADMTERLLCLEYVPNGSLQNHISDESCGLDWHERYKIIKGICLGLHHLHVGSCTPIIHLDLKPANILLTNEMEPKIADFGQSRLFDEQQSRTYTANRVGTPGYMAREYLDHGIITKKSDIFSLGVIIIEIITGYRKYPQSTGKSTQDFVEMVLEKWKERLEDLGCSTLVDCQQIKICIEIGLRCVQINAEQRPTTEEIIRSLNRCDSTNLQVTNKERTPEGQDHDDEVPDGSISDAELEAYGFQIIRNGELEELRELGSGTFGTVYYGKWQGTDVAIKRIKKSFFAGRSSEQQKLTNVFWRETEIISKLHHPNVVAFYGVVPDGTGGTLATVMEFMVDGSLGMFF